MGSGVQSCELDLTVGDQPYVYSRYCQIKFATLDSVYHVTLPVYPVI